MNLLTLCNEQIQAEIKEKLGFIPPFFTPAVVPEILESLWQQTLALYLDNPLPALFKEKLSAYLSRFCNIPYCMICHSSSLHALGMESQQILKLLESPPPTEAEIEQHLHILAAHSSELKSFPEANSDLEASLLSCAIFIALKSELTEYCRAELRRLLGAVNYQYLVTFIAYVKSCHTWVEAYPEIAYQADQRFKNHFHNLVREAPELAEFFENYRERVKLQCQTWREQQAEIAERQRHQEALRRMEVENLRLAQAIASTSEGVIITDPHQPDNPIIYSNPAFSRITGYSAAEILGCNCRFLQGEHTDRQMIAKIRQAINERREFTATLLNYRKNGQPFWNELKLSPVFADNGELLYFVGIQADVTAEKSLEEERIQLWQREQIARTEAEAARNQIINILESITDAFCALDKNWQFIYLNTQAEVLLQRPKEELIGQNVWDKFPEALGSTFSQEFDKALSQQISVVFEAYYAPLETWFTVHAYPSASGLSIYFQDINKRKQNEVALQESEARFRRLVDSNIIAVMIANLNGGITVANDAFLNMLGYSREDLLAGNLRCNQMTLPEYKELDQIALEALRSGGVCTPYEKAFRRQNGSSVPVLIGAALLEGLPDTCICFVLDLSEQKQHQEALRKTNQMLQALIVAAPLAILTLDLQKNIQMWNPTAERIFGWSESEILHHQLPIVPEIEQEHFCQLCENALQGESFTGVEVQCQKRDGSLIDISISVAPLQDVTGAVNGIMAVLTDITKNKQAEQKIREQAALLDVTTDAIYVRNFEQQILFWNKGAERLFGWTATEVKGLNEIKILHPEKPTDFLVAEKTVLAQGEWQGELHLQTKAGKKITVASRWTLMLDEQQNVKSILVVNTDITDKKLLELQFLRAQRMESIGTLASGIAHDLNNVLTPILCSAQLLIQAKVTEEKKLALLESIQNSSRRGAALIKQVLSFARGVEGKRTVLQIRHLITEIRQIIEETFPKTIRINTNIPNDIWLVCGDATQLHQVLMNLCVNARDAMLEGGTLTIKASNVWVDSYYAKMNLDAQVGSYILIEVSDNGVGIPQEIIDRIFEPFFTTKEVGKGTGLGLSTVVGIIKSHGGFVEVTSSEGKGTQFKVYLPAVKESESLKSAEAQLSIGEGELILVVDDEATICKSNKTALEAYNYRVLTAADGVEAIALYAQHKHDIRLVLIDLMMPIMDGATTIRTLKKINPKVEIIAVSGLVSSNQMPEMVSSQIQAFLPKPYTVHDLIKSINQVLQNR